MYTNKMSPMNITSQIILILLTNSVLPITELSDEYI